MGRAHPRERGEHALHSAANPALPGSSPRARGAHVRAELRPLEVGLIPASAGSTWPWKLTKRRTRAHPRERGEHWLAGETWALDAGSSPRARGARLRCRTRARARGLIPASAGSTGFLFFDCGAGGAHPRERGEHFANNYVDGPDRGSSPRARGAREDRGFIHRQCGLIPASAGSTTHAILVIFTPGAHPRERGEHTC